MTALGSMSVFCVSLPITGREGWNLQDGTLPSCGQRRRKPLVDHDYDLPVAGVEERAGLSARKPVTKGHPIASSVSNISSQKKLTHPKVIAFEPATLAKTRFTILSLSDFYRGAVHVTVSRELHGSHRNVDIVVGGERLLR